MKYQLNKKRPGNIKKRLILVFVVDMLTKKHLPMDGLYLTTELFNPLAANLTRWLIVLFYLLYPPHLQW
jgi:hypothetical protein